MPFIRLGFVALACLLTTLAFAAPDVSDYAAVTPGPCVTGDEALRAAWLDGHARILVRDYPGAMSLLSPIMTACPDDASTRHLAALCAWGIGQRALATRWMVHAFRQGPPEPAMAAALAALHADAATESVAIGWLRRGLEPLDASARAFWITRPSFNRLWRSGSEAWRALVRDFGLPYDLDVARAMGMPPHIVVRERTDETDQAPLLQLSPFDPRMDTMDRALQMRMEVTHRLIQRIRPAVELQAEIPDRNDDSLVYEDDLMRSEEP